MKNISLALVTSSALISAPRAVMAAPRADISDPKVLLAQLQSAFETFKTENEQKLAAKADIVVAEKLDRIDATIGDLQSALDEQARIMAAAAINPKSVVGDMPASTPELISGFKSWMRTGDVHASMSEGTAANGGYLAPVEWDRTITGKLKAVSPMREHARVVTISTGGFSKVYNDRVLGSGWVGETAARPETTTPGFGSLNFTMGELYCNPAISQTLLSDAAIDLEQWLADEVNLEFAKQEAIAFLSGNGTSKPRGLLTYVTGGASAAIHPWGAITTLNSGHATTIPNGDPLLDLIYDLPAQFTANAKLFVNRLSLRAIRKLKDGQGNYLWQPSYATGLPQTVAGVPTVEMTDLAAPSVAGAFTNGDIAALYGDMDATYLIVDHVQVTVFRDPYTNKPFVHFYTSKRVGGGVHNPEPMRALKISV